MRAIYYHNGISHGSETYCTCTATTEPQSKGTMFLLRLKTTISVISVDTYGSNHGTFEQGVTRMKTMASFSKCPTILFGESLLSQLRCVILFLSKHPSESPCETHVTAHCAPRKWQTDPHLDQKAVCNADTCSEYELETPATKFHALMTWEMDWKQERLS